MTLLQKLDFEEMRFRSISSPIWRMANRSPRIRSNARISSSTARRLWS
ncbi:hypothetical protein P0F65_14225 [Sphingomonas sp. I4]